MNKYVIKKMCLVLSLSLIASHAHATRQDDYYNDLADERYYLENKKEIDRIRAARAQRDRERWAEYDRRIKEFNPRTEMDPYWIAQYMYHTEHKLRAEIDAFRSWEEKGREKGFVVSGAEMQKQKQRISQWNEIQARFPEIKAQVGDKKWLHEFIQENSENSRFSDIINNGKVNYETSRFIKAMLGKIRGAPFVVVAIDGYLHFTYKDQEKYIRQVKTQILDAVEKVRPINGKVVVLMQAFAQGSGAAAQAVEELKDSGVKNLVVGSFVQPFQDKVLAVKLSEAGMKFTLSANADAYLVRSIDGYSKERAMSPVMDALSRLQKFPGIVETRYLAFEGGQETFDRLVQISNMDAFKDKKVDLRLFLGQEPSDAILHKAIGRHSPVLFYDSFLFRAATFYHFLNQKTGRLKSNPSVQVKVNGLNSQVVRSALSEMKLVYENPNFDVHPYVEKNAVVMTDLGESESRRLSAERLKLAESLDGFAERSIRDIHSRSINPDEIKKIQSYFEQRHKARFKPRAR